MVALRKEFSMSQRFGNRHCFATDLLGPYVGSEIEDAHVTCYLEIGNDKISVDIPSEVLDTHRASDGRVVLRIPGQRSATVETSSTLSEREQRVASGWSAEMEDFDRF